MSVKGKHLLHYVPHGINHDEFKPLDKNDKNLVKIKKEVFQDKEYNFVILFNSRNAHRKHPANLILAFRSFCDSLTKEQANKCLLFMHTDKVCDAGTDLVATVKAICPDYKVVLNDKRSTPEEMIAYYNMADVTVNCSSNEGFGLSIAESIMCGTPVVATVTGGLQDQLGLTDDDGNSYSFNLEFGTNISGKYKKHGKWSYPLFPKVSNMQGSPPTPYILDDFTNYSDIADALMYWYLMSNEDRELCGQEGRRWSINEGGINAKNMCDQFIKGMDFTIENFVPQKTFGLYKSEDYDIEFQPKKTVGFEIHKVDIQTVRTKLEKNGFKI